MKTVVVIESGEYADRYVDAVADTVEAAVSYLRHKDAAASESVWDESPPKADGPAQYLSYTAASGALLTYRMTVFSIVGT